MEQGLIPFITEECNFPDVFEKDLGVLITTDKMNIKQALESTSTWDSYIIRDKSARSRELILEQYSLKAITQKQISVYIGAVSKIG